MSVTRCTQACPGGRQGAALAAVAQEATLQMQEATTTFLHFPKRILSRIPHSESESESRLPNFRQILVRVRTYPYPYEYPYPYPYSSLSIPVNQVPPASYPSSFRRAAPQVVAARAVESGRRRCLGVSGISAVCRDCHAPRLPPSRTPFQLDHHHHHHHHHHQVKKVPTGRGLHSSTFQLNLNAL
jgi:hypothetical protein